MSTGDIAQRLAAGHTTPATTADCGHQVTPTAISTGYGTDPETGKSKCFDCCLADDIRRLRTEQRFTAYVSADGRTLVNWPGGTLGRITSHHVSRAARKTYVQVTDVHGAKWYGVGPAESGTYVSLRRYAR